MRKQQYKPKVYKDNVKSNIVLIGFMASGKSTVARKLGGMLKRKIVDIDRLIEEEEGRSIPKIFEESGETYFRELETKMLERFKDSERMIISCGGGIVVKESNIEKVKKCGIVVLLKIPPLVILERVLRNQNRPMLQDNKNESYIRELLEKRKENYKRAADITVFTDNKSIQMSCVEILKKVRRMEREKSDF